MKTNRNELKRKMGVKQLIRYFENNPIPPYRPIPAPRTKKQQPQPIPAPTTKITKKSRALKGYTQSYEISIKNDKDALQQLQNIRLATSRVFEQILNEIKGFKFVETIKVDFEKLKGGELIDKTAYFNSRAHIIMNKNDILPSLEKSQEKLVNDIGEWLAQGSGWTIDSILGHDVVNYKPLECKSYIPLPKELQNSLKGLINLKNEDSECFR